MIMKNIYRKLKNFYFSQSGKTKTIFFLILTQFSSLALIVSFKLNLLIKMFLMTVIALIPSLLLILITLDTKIYRKYERYKWVSLLKYIIITLYLVIANNYSFTIINDLFKVDPSLFPITSIFLTLLFPIHLVTQVSNLAVIIFSMLIIFLAIKSLSLFIKGFLFTLYLSFVFGTSYSYLKNLKINYIEKVALTFDFVKEHRCVNLKDANKLIFMNNGKVFTYYENKNINKFLVEDCNFN